ncbi:MAG: type II toxin-antitoxin system Phd/YefM family antitoxin [Rhodopirellula sp. JB044]|uniref:type II toxin-antitoxin system Phd/YefM family antitoxin n=1 Tax=Rhodopirellula sp. JB044 TaxID=3342844 RepID=UPI00370CD7E4
MADEISIDDAQGHLKDLIAGLAPGAELVITDDDKPVAKLVSEQKKPAEFRKLGLGKGMITIVNGDDAHLDDFAEYMQ